VRLTRALVGSFPRVRGGQRGPGRWLVRPGLIPARAGRTVCRVGAGDLAGLIAARAGRTRRPRGVTAAVRLIPRACEADIVTVVAVRRWWGLIPRVRGRRPAPGIHNVRRGLIPACAGRTRASSRSTIWCRAHPRECGADGVDTGVWPIRYSSFRIRGALVAHYIETTCQRGSSPRAGRTPATVGDWRRAGAHPRVRGGLQTVAGRHPRGRLIPACVSASPENWFWHGFRDLTRHGSLGE